MNAIIEEHISQDNLALFCRKHHIKRVSLFGSAVRGELNFDSDIDLLVEFKEDEIPGLFDLSRMEIELTSLFERKVDLRTPEELSRYFREDVVSHAEVQYESGE